MKKPLLGSYEYLTRLPFGVSTTTFRCLPFGEERPQSLNLYCLFLLLNDDTRL